MENINDVITKLRNLNLDQQQLVAQLITEISATNTTNTPSSTQNSDKHFSNKRNANPHFISSNGVALAIGDKVRILSNRKTGKYGDLAEVIHFNKKYVAIQVVRNQSNTQRASKYLEFVNTSG